MPSARPDAPKKLVALRALADNEPGAQDMTGAESNHLFRNDLVEITHLPGGKRLHTITEAGWALLEDQPESGHRLRSVNPARPGHDIAVGDIVAYNDGLTLSGARRSREAAVVEFSTAGDGTAVAVLKPPGRRRLRRPLARLIRVDPPPPAPQREVL